MTLSDLSPWDSSSGSDDNAAVRQARRAKREYRARAAQYRFRAEEIPLITVTEDGHDGGATVVRVNDSEWVASAEGVEPVTVESLAAVDPEGLSSSASASACTSSSASSRDPPARVPPQTPPRTCDARGCSPSPSPSANSFASTATTAHSLSRPNKKAALHLVRKQASKQVSAPALPRTPPRASVAASESSSTPKRASAAAAAATSPSTPFSRQYRTSPVRSTFSPTTTRLWS
eukprot:Rhum_TRINITY_DN25399_c0_g1::Rhum_TRINITY_DN25399_c0_g1_i1::g.182004::m.182004